MNFKFQISNHILAGIVIVIMCVMYSGIASAELTVNANHDYIPIDFFYHGSTVSVSGLSDAGTDLIIKITAPDGHEALNQKGKAAGFLWMNLGTLKFEHAPNLYFIHGTKKPEEILNAENMNKYIIGYPSMNKHIEITPVSNDEERTKWFNEFIRYKEASRLYTASSGQIKTTNENGMQKYYIQTDWPYQAPPGEYLVTVYAVKNKKVVEKAEAKVTVEQAGIVKALSGMAKNNGALYGIISIIAALGVGFGVGMIFGKDGGAH
ncbi:MAG: TIGR02186 family protein [Nitrospirae bacterium]|nr:TIGR02186 family protein [Nitrospirota bacterium]MCL5976874.1 TIGR02186 family protein [Nitrospirota bacterium]